MSFGTFKNVIKNVFTNNIYLIHVCKFGFGTKHYND